MIWAGEPRYEAMEDANLFYHPKCDRLGLHHRGGAPYLGLHPPDSSTGLANVNSSQHGQQPERGYIGSDDVCQTDASQPAHQHTGTGNPQNVEAYQVESGDTLG